MKAWALVLALLLAPQEKKTAPDDAALKEAEKGVRDLFKDDFAKKTPADKRVLAKKLLAQGRETANAAPTQYALLTLAVELGVQSVDVDTCAMAMTELSAAFAIDVVAQRNATLTALGKVVKTPEDLRALAKAYLQLADEAVKADRFDDGTKAAEGGSALSKRAKDLAGVNAADAKSREVAGRKLRAEKAKKAKEALAAMPEDPAANLEVGKYYCLVKNDWAAGLPLLAKSPDGPLKAAAQKDSGASTVPAERVAIGDLWWDAADSVLLPDEKFPLHERAGFWYEPVYTKVAEADKKRVESRVYQLNSERLARQNWVELNDPAFFGRPEKLGEAIQLTVPKDGRSIFLQSKPFPPGEFDGLQIHVRMKDKGDASFDFKGPGYVRDIGVVLRANANFLYLPGDTWPTGMMFVATLPPVEDVVITIIHDKDTDVLYWNGQPYRRWPNLNDHFDQIRLINSFGTVQFDKIKIRKRG